MALAQKNRRVEYSRYSIMARFDTFCSIVLLSKSTNGKCSSYVDNFFLMTRHLAINLNTDSLGHRQGSHLALLGMILPPSSRSVFLSPRSLKVLLMCRSNFSPVAASTTADSRVYPCVVYLNSVPAVETKQENKKSLRGCHVI